MSIDVLVAPLGGCNNEPLCSHIWTTRSRGEKKHQICQVLENSIHVIAKIVEEFPTRHEIPLPS
jgi:hypothetical protein